MDLKTPINASLSAFFQRSFAYQTVRSRLPAILSQTIDLFSKRKDDIVNTYGEEAEEEIKTIVREIGKLKWEVQNNKPLRKLVGDAEDIGLYNKFLELHSIKISYPTYFNANWLFVECYMYRRIKEAFEQTKLLKDIDPFESQKEDSFHKTMQIMALMGYHLLTILNATEQDKEQEFIKLIKLNLWGNKCDLSLTVGRSKFDTDQVMDVDRLNPNILCDHSLDIWDALTKNSESHIMDIVLDNAGYELFTDMCVADFVLKNKYVEQIRFYVKAIPWYISDVTAKDFHWTLHQLKTSKNTNLKKLGERWNNYMRIKAWTIEEDNYWTLPVTYKDMSRWDIELYRKLSAAKLIIFKGDVNYRKLFGERNWPTTTPIVKALQGFHPSKLCTLRTIKAHIICGLEFGVAENIEQTDKDWLITGHYGVIQFCDKVIKK